MSGGFRVRKLRRARKTWLTFSDISSFFLLGGGEGSLRRQDGGGVFFCVENPRRGVSRERGGEVEGPRGCLREISGGGAKHFLPGPKFPPRKEGQETLNKSQEDMSSRVLISAEK